MVPRRLAIVVLSGCALLSGCATYPPQTALPPAQALTLFNTQAQIIIRPSKSSGAQRFFVDWQRFSENDGYRDEIAVYDSLGITQAQLTITPQQAKLRYQGKVIREKDSRVLAKHLFGYVIPVDAVGYWINGESAPQSPVQEVIAEGNKIREIRQHDWKISYLAYDSDELPKTVLMAAPNGLQVNVKILRRIDSQ